MTVTSYSRAFSLGSMMMRFLRAALLLPCAVASAPAAEIASADWRQEATKAGLGDAEQTLLDERKVLTSRVELKQCFSAYLRGGQRSFVTTDAVLNAYHVLFEETMRHAESRNEVVLRKHVAALSKALGMAGKLFTGDAALIRAAQRRAVFVIGVAARLLGEKPDGGMADLMPVIESEATRIEKAEGEHKPAMLGAPEPEFVAFDYTLFRPAGFYDESPSMQRYFRAVRWLQLVPFRAGHREELLAGVMMQAAMDEAGGIEEGEFYESQGIWKEFGLEGHPGWLAAHARRQETWREVEVDDAFFKAHADDLRQLLAPHRAAVLANDRIREAPLSGERSGEIRLLSSVLLPEDAMLRSCLKTLNSHSEANR